MSHSRVRYAYQRLLALSKASPIVGVLGQRQVGKSTLLDSICNEYVTFDKESILRQAKQDGEVFLQGRESPFAIDEAQLCPEIFPALKEHVRIRPKRGQFIPSGSVRFTSRKAIRESLTGRILNCELLPFSIGEAHSRPLSSTIEFCSKFDSGKLESKLLKSPHSNSKEFWDYLEKGGLPGICLSRDSGIRDDRWQTHLDTLLNRDYRQLHPTTLPYEALRDSLLFLAQTQGRPLELNKLSAASRISHVTIKKVLQSLEGLFLIRSVPLLGDSKGVTYFLEDQGMASWLTASSADKSSQSIEWDIVRGLYANLRHEIWYRPELRGSMGSFRTRHGVLVHLVFQTTYGRLGIIACPDKDPRPKTIAAVKAFQKKYPSSRVIIAYAGEKCVFKSNSHFWLPYWLLV